MIEKIIIISLIVTGIWYTLQEGEIFGRIGNWLHTRLPSWALNPVVECVVCMAPWYGAVICLIMGWPLWLVIPAMGLNVIIDKFLADD